MQAVPTSIPGVVILEPKVFGDARGFFIETWNERVFQDLGLHRHWVQDNHSRSVRGVLRGLHYQLTHAQAKLVRVLRGSVIDVAVDCRRGSPTFGRHVAVELSEDNRRMLFIPEGFAHGFHVTSEVCEFAYKVSDFYDPSGERGIIWNDPGLGIDWGVRPGEQPQLSGKDAKYPTLAAMAAADLPLWQG